MIVSRAQLSCFRGAVAMVSGGFDPIHEGHVEYFRQAGALGAPLLCNVSPDDFVASKHPPLLPQAERAKVIDAIRYIDLTYMAEGTTEDVLRELQPRFFVKGNDWGGRLPPEEAQVCEQHGVEVVFLDTVLNSSSSILERYAKVNG